MEKQAHAQTGRRFQDLPFQNREECLSGPRSFASSLIQGVATEQFAETPAPENLSPDYLAVQRSEVDRAWDIVASLPSTLRQAFVLVTIEELTYQQAAIIANTSESTLRGRVARARKAFIEAVS
ncbi:MAG TPA: sigma factor-like helix-turn-helix DNA-binding protein [Glutamicibacter sp.]|nr:sigma factor-like helix-turn-helix DNA-binding protein [Glutamicibacter sp.]HJX79608.1 sigma factor-like helix-turn-helix DNA-binding protein [Glutamicibacter sp.]